MNLLCLQEHTFVVWNKEANLAGVGDGAEAELFQGGGFRQTGDVGGGNDGFGVGMTKPTGNPLSEGEGHRLPAKPRP